MKKPTAKKKKKKGSRKKNQPEASLRVIEGSKAGSDSEKHAETNRKDKPSLPPKKEPEKKRDEKNPISKYIGMGVQFLRESRLELKKVKWPTRKELFASTAIVILLVLIIALFLGLIDLGLIKLIKAIVG
jgi:preprotein translocase subunit SecE